MPNFLVARCLVTSQLNVQEWGKQLPGDWDVLLIHFVRHCFHLGFNRSMHLISENINHVSAIQYLSDIVAHLQEDISHGAFVVNIQKAYTIMSFPPPPPPYKEVWFKSKPVIIDLSWHRETSVDDGIDKYSYLGTEFPLTFLQSIILPLR